MRIVDGVACDGCYQNMKPENAIFRKKLNRMRCSRAMKCVNPPNGASIYEVRTAYFTERGKRSKNRASALYTCGSSGSENERLKDKHPPHSQLWLNFRDNFDTTPHPSHPQTDICHQSTPLCAFAEDQRFIILRTS